MAGFFIRGGHNTSGLFVVVELSEANIVWTQHGLVIRTFPKREMYRLRAAGTTMVPIENGINWEIYPL